AAGSTGIWLFVRWAVALPILFFEDQALLAALRASRARVRGAGWRIALILTGWLLGIMLAGMMLAAAFRLFAGTVLELAREPRVLHVLLCWGSWAGRFAPCCWVGFAGAPLFPRQLSRGGSNPNRPPRPAGTPIPRNPPEPAPPWNWHLALLLWIPFLLLAPLA